LQIEHAHTADARDVDAGHAEPAVETVHRRNPDARHGDIPDARLADWSPNSGSRREDILRAIDRKDQEARPVLVCRDVGDLRNAGADRPQRTFDQTDSCRVEER
jgi:hypothetical protein